MFLLMLDFRREINNDEKNCPASKKYRYRDDEKNEMVPQEYESPLSEGRMKEHLPNAK
jgi:hypothetical protein